MRTRVPGNNARGTGERNRILGFDNRVGLPILIPALLFFLLRNYREIVHVV